ncbi:restriction endonuclease, partial [Ferrovum myxofaciens]|uniref:restriction endonuclease n=1 Tax=Ferrovum myxofaciens TaxID=416213 RepID=UPI00123742E5
MTALSDLLASYRQIAQTQREKGTYFEKLILCYLKAEPKYRDLYQDAWMYEDWAHRQGQTGQDSGIDLVAEVRGTGEFHAIQCKLYAEDYKLQKGDIDSFL